MSNKETGNTVSDKAYYATFNNASDYSCNYNNSDYYSINNGINCLCKKQLIRSKMDTSITSNNWIDIVVKSQPLHPTKG